VRNWYRTTVGGLPRLYWYLWAGMLINRVGGFVALVLSLYLTSARHLAIPVAGLVVGVYGIGGIAGVLLGGVLADRWGRRPTLLLAHFGAVAVLCGLIVARPIPAVAILAALLGLMHAMPGPAFVAAIVDVTPAADRSRAFNLQFWAFNLGMAVASVLAGALAEVSFTLLFTVDAAGTLLTALLILWKVRETRPRHKAVASKKGLHTALTDRAYLLFVGLSLLLAVLSTQTTGCGRRCTAPWSPTPRCSSSSASCSSRGSSTAGARAPRSPSPTSSWAWASPPSPWPTVSWGISPPRPCGPSAR
jgi:MFS family permease